MNFPSIINTLKSYPLLISVVTASVIMAAVFAIQDNSSETAESIPTDTAPVSTGITAASTAPIDENNTSSESTGVSSDTAETYISSEGAFSVTSVTTTTAPPAAVQFVTVEDDYFYDALFIGNSRTVGLSMYGSMPDEATFYATEGMNIYDLMESTAQIPPNSGPEQSFTSLINGESFGKVYIMLGINDLGTGTSESFAEYYKGIIDSIHASQPDAIIYVQSIINISAERHAQGDIISNDNINEKNALLKELANDEYIFYLDVNEALRDENGYLNSEYTSDGIHLGGGSLSLWEDYLYSHAVEK